ncbi:MAG: OprO/OprP family phosphate-selective porin [Bryobacteraceae bacterium]
MNRLSILVLSIAATGLSAESDDAQSLVREEPAAVRFEMKRRPSLRVGDWLKMDFRAKVQTDLAGSPDRPLEEGFFDPRRARVGVEGRLGQDLEFEVEYELLPNDHQLRDAFLNYRRIRRLQLQAGKFKIPFGLDQLTGPTNLDFVYRSRIGSQLAPGRDTGFMLHGNLFEKGLRYQAGLFLHDGEIAEATNDVRTGNRTLAGRITATPATFFPMPSLFKGLELGTAFTHGQVSEGAHSLRGRTAASETFLSRLYVNGYRTRQGTEMTWLIGSLSLQGEFMNVREQRRGQSLAGSDLPDLTARGWYASATHPIFGARPKGNDSNRLHAMVPGFHKGLLEVAARYEQLRFASGFSPSAPSRSPRAAHVLPNSERALTLGVNWYANRYTKFQLNAIRETLEDPLRSPVSGMTRLWLFAGRVQFVL